MRTKGIPKSQRTKKFLFRIPITLLFSILLILVVYYGVFQDYHPRTLSPYETTLADFKLVSGNRMIQSGRIVVLFVGAEACPYCAAESWSIVASLGQYGIWKGLSPIISNKTDSIPSVPGYSFVNATLNSSKVLFEEVELTTTSWNQKLQSLNSTQHTLFYKCDPSGSIPYLLIGGIYIHLGSAVNPELISGMSLNLTYNLSKSQGAFRDQIISEERNISEVIDYVTNPPPSSNGLETPKYIAPANIMFSDLALIYRKGV